MKTVSYETLDQIDRHILGELSRDGRISVAELSRRVAGDPFPARVEPGTTFADGADVVTDATAVPSPRPPRGLFGQ